MTYPTITIASANAMLSSVGIEIQKHPLGYYQAKGRGQEWQSPKLVDLTHMILKHLVNEG